LRRLRVENCARARRTALGFLIGLNDGYVHALVAPHALIRRAGPSAPDPVPGPAGRGAVRLAPQPIADAARAVVLSAAHAFAFDLHEVGHVELVHLGAFAIDAAPEAQTPQRDKLLQVAHLDLVRALAECGSRPIVRLSSVRKLMVPR
jgi:hypothetical protein